MPGVVISGSSGGKEFDAKFTWEVFKCATIAASGGLMFGYDIGVSGINCISVLLFMSWICSGKYLQSVHIQKGFLSCIIYMYSTRLI